MSGDTDFLGFYRQLGIEPGCSLPTFKQAYRRRVRELHPDRMDGGRHDSEGLKELNLLYAESLAFHRLHGRLPGATPAPAARFSTLPPTSVRVVETRRTGPPAMPQRPPSRWLLFAFSLVAIVPLWTLIPSLDNGAREVQQRAPSPRGQSLAVVPTAVELGMDEASVAALLGVPIVDADNAGHWLYGPSWVRFECGQVVDWYSSLLHPLPVAGPQPAASFRGKEPARRPKSCPGKPRQESMVYPADATFALYSGVA